MGQSRNKGVKGCFNFTVFTLTKHIFKPNLHAPEFSHIFKLSISTYVLDGAYIVPHRLLGPNSCDYTSLKNSSLAKNLKPKPKKTQLHIHNPKLSVGHQ